jgi:hypothetical protein
MMGDYRQNAASAETFQQETHQSWRQEWHVTRGDKDVIVLRGGEAGFDAGQGPLPSGTLVGNVPDFIEAKVFAANHQDFLAGGR